MMNFSIDSKAIEDDFIRIQNLSRSDPPLSDIDIKNKMAWVWTTLKKTQVLSNLLKLQIIIYKKLEIALNN